MSDPAAGAASFAWLTRAAELVLAGEADALVTAPIAKASWKAAGHAYPGQTERLAELTGVDDAAMLFTAVAPGGGWRLNTLLATTHIPLAEVSNQLGPEWVSRRLDMLLEFCRRFSPRPRLVVAGLNPHAGEGGQLGREERDWLIPTLDAGVPSTPGCGWRGRSRRTPAGWRRRPPGAGTPQGLTATWPCITTRG